jgi:general secretion pathway protein G
LKNKNSKFLFLSKRAGFTLIELLVVIAILGILSTVVLVNLRTARDRAYLAKAKSDMRSINQALDMYLDDHSVYPPDADRDIPPGLEKYLSPGNWPSAAWPGSIFDWDNWTDPDTGEKIYQISVRFCPIGQPGQCRFPNDDWAQDFEIDSSAYYCISGPCRSHISHPVDYPGYCVNCN